HGGELLDRLGDRDARLLGQPGGARGNLGLYRGAGEDAVGLARRSPAVAGAQRRLTTVEVDHVFVDETLLLVGESHSNPRVVVSRHGPGAETEKPRGRAAT